MAQSKEQMFREKYGISQNYGGQLFGAIEDSIPHFVNTVINDREKIFLGGSSLGAVSVSSKSYLKNILKEIDPGSIDWFLQIKSTLEGRSVITPEINELLRALSNRYTRYQDFPRWIKNLQRPSEQYPEAELKADITKHVRGIIADSLQSFDKAEAAALSQVWSYLPVCLTFFIAPMLDVARYPETMHKDAFTTAHLAIMFLGAVGSVGTVGYFDRVRNKVTVDTTHPIVVQDPHATAEEVAPESKEVAAAEVGMRRRAGRIP